MTFPMKHTVFIKKKKKYILGLIETPVGAIPRVSTFLNLTDRLGAVRVRWMIFRNDYTVEPGLYAVGNPDSSSDVFVSANYKLSFDHLRKNLNGLNAWIIVLDTKGVNVWCAAGKGTFGTTELINRIRQTNLDKIINHRRLIVPQLGATGISAHQVKVLTSSAGKESLQNLNTVKTDFSTIGNLKIDRGFQVIFGPVRATDIKAFIINGYKSTPEMRKVNFDFYDRLKLTPVDFVYAGTRLLAAFAVVLFLAGLNRTGISFNQAMDKGIPAVLYLTMAYICGIFITPMLLPYIPFRMFAFKGLISGLTLAAFLLFFDILGKDFISIVSWFLLISAVSSFMAMNFTGASTFTSLSGVKKEMRVFVPVQIALAGIGLVLFVLSNFKSN
jgi:hypothetical protein